MNEMKIFKFKLSAVFPDTLQLPKGHCILSAKEQNSSICVWVQVSTEVVETQPVIFYKISAGQKMPEELQHAQFLDTVLLDEGEYVIHIYYSYTV